jgi:SpoVK/Ycf46/Vps4 family AAA+-type ATPase
LRFLYEQFVRYRDEGLTAYRARRAADARYNLLQAAACLYKLAHFTEGTLRGERVHAAARLVDMAKGMQQERIPHAAPEAAADEHTGASHSKWVMTARPSVRFDDIAGLHAVKELIRRRVLYPFRYPEATARYRKRAGGGVLLYGPPGTGKTMLAKAIATELDATFFSVKCSDVMSKWVGEAERNLKDLFAAARQEKVSVVFLDETEALVGKRGGDSTIMNRLIPEFLSQVDGVDTEASPVLLLGATNRPWDLDEAALRPGRFGEHIYVGLPDADARRQMLSDNLEGVPLAPEVEVDALVARTEGYSGADLAGLVARATDQPYSREVAGGRPDRLTADDIEQALREARPSVTKAMLARYEKFDAGQRNA